MTTPLTDRQKKIIAAAKQRAQGTTTFANEVEMSEEAHSAMLDLDAEIPLTDEEERIFLITYGAEYARACVTPTGATAMLPVEFGFTEGHLGVVTNGHRYQVRVFDHPADDPDFFIFEYFNDTRYPRVLYERSVKLTLKSWREIDKWMRARQRRQAKDRQ